MTDLSEIIKYTLPSLVALGANYFLLKNLLDKQPVKQSSPPLPAAKEQSVITPLRLQAYERLVLFLERMSPNSLIFRVNVSGMSAISMQTEMLKSIRGEFEHNLSQQIYVSPNAWEMVKQAKEETIKVVNIAAGKLNDNSTSIELSGLILEIMGSIDKSHIQSAIDFLKNEVRGMM